MKKLPFILFLFIFLFGTSASATVYKWVDRDGMLNFADDYSRIPRDYRNQVEALNVARMESSRSSPAPSGRQSPVLAPRKQRSSPLRLHRPSSVRETLRSSWLRLLK